MSVVLEGAFKLLRFAQISLSESLWIQPNGIDVDISSLDVPVPGYLTVEIQTASDSQPGGYAIPIRIETQGHVQIVWLFALVSIPFDEPVEMPAYPASSRRLGIHTDSQLREQTDNILVIKGELGALRGNFGGTGVVVKVEPGNGRILEQRDVVASSGLYSTSIRLSVLSRDTVVRAQVTWLGSSTSPGGTSPILSLPVGGYSMSRSKLLQAGSPESAVFVLGKTPEGLSPPASNEDLQGIVAEAQRTLLREFSENDREILMSKAAIQSSMTLPETRSTVVFYAVADTSEGSIQLLGGESISPSELANLINLLPAGASALLMIEGPNSGVFYDQLELYAPGTTVITSCESEDRVNRLSPWSKSFSARFFEGCQNGFSVADSFELADLSFLDFLVGQTQCPKFHRGNSAEIQLHRRFVAAGLPDLVPPEILAFSCNRLSVEGPSYELVVAVADNRDEPTNIQVEAQVLTLEGDLVEVLPLSLLESSANSHQGVLFLAPKPGFGVIVSATDSVGNRTAPQSFWVDSSGNDLLYDMDGDRIVDEDDLFFLLGKEADGRLADHWLFGFGSRWMESATAP
jgi:hypothetical protein